MKTCALDLRQSVIIVPVGCEIPRVRHRCLWLLGSRRLGGPVRASVGLRVRFGDVLRLVVGGRAYGILCSRLLGGAINSDACLAGTYPILSTYASSQPACLRACDVYTSNNQNT